MRFRSRRDQQPETLALTRQQLYREIQRHEATEILLRQSQEFIQSIIDSMPGVLIGVDPDGYVTHWNLAAMQTTGLHADDALGAHVNQVYPELAVTPKIIESTVASGNSYRRENIQQGQGSQAKFFDLTVYPLINHDSGGAVILAVDVTKQAVVESLLIQNDKMTSMGEMAAGMAHEINNPLASILSNAQNIIRRCSTDLQQNHQIADQIGITVLDIEAYCKARGILGFLENIRDSGEQAAQIVSNMLSFSRGNYQDRSLQNIVELVHDALKLTEKSLEFRTSIGLEMPRIKINMDKQLPLVQCSATEIKQVLVNLIRNAVQAFQSDEYGAPLDPVIRINIHQTRTHMSITIEDNGPGMSESVKRHIFEPFFTTKSVGQGTGLGLSVCYFIIKEHHKGVLDVDSMPGKGTIFTIRLPLPDQA